MKPLTESQIVAANLVAIADSLYREARRLRAGESKPQKADWKRYEEIMKRRPR